MYTYEFEKLILGGMDESEYQALLKEESNLDLFGQEYMEWCKTLDASQTTAAEIDKMEQYYMQK